MKFNIILYGIAVMLRYANWCSAEFRQRLKGKNLK